MLKRNTLTVSWYVIAFTLTFLLTQASPAGPLLSPVYLLLVPPSFLLPGRIKCTTKNRQVQFTGCTYSGSDMGTDGITHPVY